MDGNLFGYQIPPDMFQSINPIMILLFIPLFDFGIYPLLGTMFPFKAQFLCVSSFCPIIESNEYKNKNPSPFFPISR